ncbi:MAG: hypothetical protein KJ069_14535 [Anaerolineae bacterium]|nr:hypothetical protein [Anaerolineae bacterium]
MIYISADQPLDLISWNPKKPAFHVTEINKSEVSVRQQFHQTYVYYAGSHEGCGCGFQYGEYPEFEDEDRQLKRASLDAFAAYLTRQLKRVKLIELFACWDGDQSATPEHYHRLSPEALEAEGFFFQEKEFLQIERAAT